MIVFGVDAGLSGAVARYDTDTAVLTVLDMPTHAIERNGKNKREIDTVRLARMFDYRGLNAHVYLEQVGAMPTDGAANAFQFGKAYGIVLGIVATMLLPLTLVPPMKWKKAMSVTASKDGARARASQLLPRYADQWARVKDDGRAEAALIALWGCGELTERARIVG